MTLWEQPSATPLRLLDLTSNWLVQNGASASLAGATKNITRNWAHAIHHQYGTQIDGIYTPSTVTGDPMVVIFATAASRFPANPLVSLPLTHSAVKALAQNAGTRFNWPVATP